MNPVGNPLANSSSELMLEVIDGLKAAGVKTKDIIVFERYRDEFIGAKMDQAVPDGIAWTGLGIGYNAMQLDLKGDDRQDRQPRPCHRLRPSTSSWSWSSSARVWTRRTTGPGDRILACS